ncbi:MAG TPA: hypothetical protein VMT50_08035, partial [Steroidobacteraceae bacterium]|nr:hypothetical protein [Steroidobacteraceae bacterium]
MYKLLAITGTATLLVAAAAPAATPAMNATSTAAFATNPLLAPWSGPYGGVPPFDRVKVEQIEPAIEAAMAEELAALERIASDPAAPSFENTIAAMERSGRPLERVMTIYGVYASTMNDEAMQAVERAMAPKLAAHGDKITQNARLFARIGAVYDAREHSGLTPEQQRLTWLIYTHFVRAGAKLDADAKARLAEMNQQLAGLYTSFGQN